MLEYVYGLGGYCENCNPSHDHPLNNLIEVIEHPDVEAPADVAEIANALAQLPEEQLQALKAALGIV